MKSLDGETYYLVRIAPYRNSEGKTDGVVIAFVDITGLVRAEKRQDVLIAELQHRTRNLLSVIQSIAQHTMTHGPALETFANRLAALGRLQGLIGEANGDQIDLKDLVRLEFDAHGVGESDRITVSGPPAPLIFQNVQTIALVLHELVTNAVKYGALKQDGARLDVSWHIATDERDAASLVIDWKESGLTTAPDSSRYGFGRELIEKALRFTMQAQTMLAFGKDGISCHIEIPLPPKHAQVAIGQESKHG